MMLTLAVALAVLGCVQGQDVEYATNQLSSSALGERAQRALFSDVEGSFVLPITTVSGTSLVDNAAARQLQGDKAAFPFLATLPNQGSAVFLTVLKPCGVVLPHIHPRATEQYVIISGEMQGGIAEENGGRQNLTFNVLPGQSFVVPQGLVHYNSNKQCQSNVFIQTFNSADGGTINLVNSLAALSNVDSESFAAANLTSTSSSLGAFGLDQQCLERCGLTSEGGGTSDISADLQAFLGLAASPAGGPADAAASSVGTPPNSG